MPDLKTAITIVEILIGIAAALTLGDYLGYKIGRMKLFSIVGVTSLAIIVIFAVYAAVTLT